MENNIFKYATSELSQDAFICWFFNWFNEGDSPKLKQLVCDFCKDKLGVPSLSSVEIHRQFSRKVETKSGIFSVKIDVLVVLNETIAVIIEDKTFSSEHSDQILRYEEGLKLLQNQDDEKRLKIDKESYNISKIMSVYWKTGFYYDYDECVEADVKINSQYLISLLKDYRSESQIIDMYVQKLLNDEQWYKDHKKYWELDDKREDYSIWNTNLAKNYIAQYTMMKEIFPEKQNKLFYVDHGSSFGRPWTETWIYNNYKYCESKGDKSFEIFWRIDTDNKGSYISLRLYKGIKGKWDNRYNIFKELSREYIEKNYPDMWGKYKLDPGTKDSYKEADIVHFTINEEIWKVDGVRIKEVVKALTKNILEYAEKSYGSNDLK